MNVIPLGKTLEFAVERHVKISMDGTTFSLACTPVNLEELVLGFIVTEGIGNPESVRISISDSEGVGLVKELTITSSGSVGFDGGLGRVVAGEKFGMDELRNSLSYLETDEYRRTRGYHTAAIVSKRGLEARAYDIGRHNAVDKAVGICVKKGIEFNKTFLLFSGRISKGIAMKCVRAGIPLIVSKAAIFDSAIEVCKQTGLSAVSFATNIAVKGDALEI